MNVLNQIVCLGRYLQSQYLWRRSSYRGSDRRQRPAETCHTNARKKWNIDWLREQSQMNEHIEFHRTSWLLFDRYLQKGHRWKHPIH
jgi:hypothetical protein